MPHIPPYALVLFAFLIYIGIKQIRPRKMHIFRLLVVPAIFVFVSFRNFFEFFPAPYLICIAYATVGALAGILIGYVHVKSWTVTVNKASKTISIPGDYLMLIVFLVFFSFEFAIHYVVGAHLVPLTSLLFQSLAAFIYALFSGMSVGRNVTLGCFWFAHPKLETEAL